jgi:hypothetical protein
MHEMTKHYLIAALWSSTDNSDDQGGDYLDDNYDLDDIAPKAIEQAETDCQAFLAEYEPVIDRQYEQAGHDLWLTRNRHGAGFWDRPETIWSKTLGKELTEYAHKLGDTYAYVGDDGLIYFE